MTGLKTAKYVYERLTEQKKALEEFQATGKPLPVDGWLGRRYLYLPGAKQQSKNGTFQGEARRERRRSRSDGELTETGRSSSSSVERLSLRDTTSSPPVELEVEVLEQNDLVIVEEIYSNGSSRGTSPTTSIPSSEEDGAFSDSPIVQRTHYKLRTGTIPDKASLVSSHSHHQRSRQGRNWHSRTLDTRVQGLPYKKSNKQLALYCECHAYAIKEPRAMLFPAKSPPRDPFSSCCERCRYKCRVVRDLSNL